MQLLEEIRKSDKKPKDLLVYLSSLFKKNKKILKDLTLCLKNASDVERGICMEALEYVSKDNPEIVEPYIPEVTNYLYDLAPRVKWEAARIIANLTPKYPDKAANAVNNLLKNTKDKGTVVRWSMAFALGEIAKHNKKIQQKLVAEIKNILKKEENNGVKNVYLKALKAINKV